MELYPLRRRAASRRRDDRILPSARGRGKKSKGIFYLLLSLGYIASKFLYGLAINELGLTSEASRISTLLLVMIGVALLQLPFVRFRTFFKKKRLVLGALTRLPNAAGLWTEAIAAQQNLLLYSLVQPMQLFILFIAALIKREPLTKTKLFGTIAALTAVTVMTILIYINRGTI